MNHIAQHLLNINAVIINTKQLFTWASGIQSPIYCDNRLTISYPKVRQDITNAFVQLIKQYYPNVDVIVGTATAGIPHAAFISQQLNLPMAYVRATSKSHGKQTQIEGVIEKHQRVVIIEDLISTGGSSIKVAEILRQQGIEVLGVLAIFSYQLEIATQAFTKAHLDYNTLTNFDELIRIAAHINEADIAFLDNWKRNLLA